MVPSDSESPEVRYALGPSIIGDPSASAAAFVHRWGGGGEQTPLKIPPETAMFCLSYVSIGQRGHSTMTFAIGIVNHHKSFYIHIHMH